MGDRVPPCSLHLCVEVNTDTRWRNFSSKGDSVAMLPDDSVQERGPNICSLKAIGRQKIASGRRAPHSMGSVGCELTKVDGGAGGDHQPSQDDLSLSANFSSSRLWTPAPAECERTELREGIPPIERERPLLRGRNAPCLGIVMPPTGVEGTDNSTRTGLSHVSASW